MKMSEFKMKCLLVSGLLLVGSEPAFATSISSASLGFFRVHLTDLDENDGVNPSIRWVIEETRRVGAVEASGPSNSAVYAFNFRDIYDFGNIQASLAIPSTQASAQYDFRGEGIIELSASGLANSGEAYAALASVGGNTFLNGFNDDTYNPVSFILSANTLATFSVDVDIAASSNAGNAYARAGFLVFDLANLHQNLADDRFFAYPQQNATASIFSESGTQHLTLVEGNNVDMHDAYGDNGFSTTLALEYMNADSQSHRGVIRFESLAFGSEPTSVTTTPIPAAAWLFGSALCGFAGLRRKMSV